MFRIGARIRSTDKNLTRAGQLARLRTEGFELAVIGGGINGAAVARDAAMRGVKVALVDKGDFAGGTSSRSSKLIHGGLRYLPQGQLKLVYEALRERERLRHLTAPHLVRPIRFLFPLFKGRGPGRVALGAGLWLYDLLARTPRAERHQNLNAAATLKLEPALERDTLKGGALYYDAFADDARLTLENVLDAAYHGAAVANYVCVEGFIKQAGRIRAAALEDKLSGERFELNARVFVNAAGPWVDEIRHMDDPQAAPCVRLTKGVHMVVARERMAVTNSLVLADDNGRIVFVMPQGRYVLIGTTDTDFDGDKDQVWADRGDLAYLIEVTRQSLPGIDVSERDVLSTYAGLRALLHDGRRAPSSVPREETILTSPSGLLSVAGGKLTTHRRIAQKLTDLLMRHLGRPAGRCPTLDTPLPGARPLVDANGGLATLAPEIRGALLDRFGTRALLVEREAARRAELAEPLAAGCQVIGAEVVWAVRAELAVSLADFLARRSALVWRYPREAEEAAPRVARLMGQELGWDGARKEAELAGFAADLRTRRAA